MFPRMTATNLEGRTFVLPDDFEGATNLIFVAFTEEQQRYVDSWLAGVGDWRGRFPGLRVYELPTLPRRLSLFRRTIDGWMRAGIPDRLARAATITLYLDKSAFRSALGLSGEGTIYALLVDRAGRVLWRAAGPYSADKGCSLLNALGGAAGAGEPVAPALSGHA